MGSASSYNVTLTVGSKSRDWDIYVAPIRDSLLMGFDFMLAADVTILGGDKVFVEGEPVPSYISGRSQESYVVSRVLLLKPSALPPQSEYVCMYGALWRTLNPG